MTIKNKLISGSLWNSLEVYGGHFVQLIITIVLARILTPDDFGVIGLLIIFIELSKVILDSGISKTLIRQKNLNNLDYSSVFYFNIILGLILYSVLFFLSPYISEFYQVSDLTNYSRYLFIIILINSFSIVPEANIIKKINFKVLAKRTIIANTIAGLTAIYLAYNGYGVWALIYQVLIAATIRTILVLKFSDWYPSFEFSMSSVRSIFEFSKNILFARIFDSIVSNLQGLLIGKYYTTTQLGYYSQADRISRISYESLTRVVSNVSYPSLSLMQDDNDKLKKSYKKIIRIAVLIVFPLMLGLLSISNNLIPFILGEKWIPSINYFMLLCIFGAIFPLYSINQNIFLIKGNSKLYFRISNIKSLITLFMTVFAVQYSVLAIVVARIVSIIINTFITMLYSGREIQYSLKEQLKDISGIVSCSVIMAVCIYLLGLSLGSSNYITVLAFQICFGILIFIVSIVIINPIALNDFKEIISEVKK